MSSRPSPIPGMIARYLVHVACGCLVPGRVLMRRFNLSQSELCRHVSDYNIRALRQAGFPIESVKGPDGGYKLGRLLR